MGTQNSQQSIPLWLAILIFIGTLAIATAIVVVLFVLTTAIEDGAISLKIQWNALFDNVRQILNVWPIWLFLLVLAFGGAFLDEAKDAALRHRREGKVGGNLLHGFWHAWREKCSAGMFYRFWGWVMFAIAGALLALLLTFLSPNPPKG